MIEYNVEVNEADVYVDDMNTPMYIQYAKEQAVKWSGGTDYDVLLENRCSPIVLGDVDEDLLMDYRYRTVSEAQIEQAFERIYGASLTTEELQNAIEQGVPMDYYQDGVFGVEDMRGYETC